MMSPMEKDVVMVNTCIPMYRNTTVSVLPHNRTHTSTMHPLVELYILHVSQSTYVILLSLQKNKM